MTGFTTLWLENMKQPIIIRAQPFALLGAPVSMHTFIAPLPSGVPLSTEHTLIKEFQQCFWSTDAPPIERHPERSFPHAISLAVNMSFLSVPETFSLHSAIVSLHDMYPQVQKHWNAWGANPTQKTLFGIRPIHF